MQQLLLILFLLYHTKENKGTTTKNLIPLSYFNYTIPKKIRELQRCSGAVACVRYYTIPKKIRELQLIQCYYRLK